MDSNEKKTSFDFQKEHDLAQQRYDHETSGLGQFQEEYDNACQKHVSFLLDYKFDHVEGNQIVSIDGNAMPFDYIVLMDILKNKLGCKVIAKAEGRKLFRQQRRVGDENVAREFFVVGSSDKKSVYETDPHWTPTTEEAKMVSMAKTISNAKGIIDTNHDGFREERMRECVKHVNNYIATNFPHEQLNVFIDSHVMSMDLFALLEVFEKHRGCKVERIMDGRYLCTETRHDGTERKYHVLFGEEAEIYRKSKINVEVTPARDSDGFVIYPSIQTQSAATSSGFVPDSILPDPAMHPKVEVTSIDGVAIPRVIKEAVYEIKAQFENKEAYEAAAKEREKNPEFIHEDVHDWQPIDEISIKTVPRFKTSFASGNEWRFNLCVELKRKGVLISADHFNDMAAAAAHVPSLWYKAAETAFSVYDKKKGTVERCDQEGCSEPSTVRYTMKRVRGYGSNKGEDGLTDPQPGYKYYRTFCDRHSTRGNQSYEDCDDNYELVEKASTTKAPAPVQEGDVSQATAVFM